MSRLAGGVIASASLRDLHAMLTEARLASPVPQDREAQLVEALRARREPLARMIATHDLLRRLDARFLIVGGVAVRFYAPTRRPPNDYDVLLEPTTKAGRALLTAWTRAGAPPILAIPADFTRPLMQVRDRDALAIDVLTPPEGFNFAAHYDAATVATLADIPVRIASPDTLRVILRLAIESMPERAEGFAADLALLDGQPLATAGRGMAATL